MQMVALTCKRQSTDPDTMEFGAQYKHWKCRNHVKVDPNNGKVIKNANNSNVTGYTP